MHVIEHRFPSEPSLEESDIVKYATKLRISFQQLQFLHGQTKVCPFEGDVIQLHGLLPLPLASV